MLVAALFVGSILYTLGGMLFALLGLCGAFEPQADEPTFWPFVAALAPIAAFQVFLGA